MSLYVQTEESYSRLYYNLHNLLRHDRVTVSAWEAEWARIRGMRLYKSKEDFLRVKVYGFLKRVFLFNQLAVMNFYEFRKSGTYTKELVVLVETFKARKRLLPEELARLLGSVSYNCIDNNGYKYIGETDNQVLEELRAKLGQMEAKDTKPWKARPAKARKG